ncbi:MAG TPA: 3-dehydroquinate synthase [Desulfobulbus sp.]|nr:3-dehydroquinate synthase [Desulfobulbus sp.]
MADSTNPVTVQVGLGERSYPIRIAAGTLDRVGEDLQEREIARRYCVISDDHVAGLYGERLMRSLASAGITAGQLTFPRGEESKNLQTIADLASALARKGYDRGDGLIALGGGVTGDITGFLASIYMRGIPFVQVPTTLLAQVDSSVGGKTGVDIPEGKNLVGTFYQPRVVYIDTDCLATLPRQELLGGLAEVIKYGVIRDRDFFDFLEKQREAILALDNDAVSRVIGRCCEIKARVVEEDEREGGLRRILNFGHTLGHAIEAASRFRIIHGLAIAMGMRAAADLAVRSGLLAEEDAARIRSLLEAYGMPVKVPPELDRSEIRSYLQTDKKTVSGRVFFVLPEVIGRVCITDDVRAADIDAVLDSD